MLILSRRVSETITIGNNAEITITVLGVKGNQVRLGVKAPKEIEVDREEVHNRRVLERSQVLNDDIRPADTIAPTFISSTELPCKRP